MTYQTTDFGYRHCGKWRDGQLPKVTTRVYVVSYDTSHDAYTVEADEFGDFIDWIAENWGYDRGPDEESREYLDRIDVRVWEYA